MRLVERDYIILREIDRWRYCQGRHIRHLAGFTGERATDRRLKILREACFIEKKKIIYGVASVYTLTSKGKILLGASPRVEKIRLEQIMHDIAVLDTAIYYMQKHNINLSEIITEKDLHSKDGFGIRKHHPDFLIDKNNKITSVEVELTLKAKERFLKNIESNFLNYDYQIWVVPNTAHKILAILKESQKSYNNIKIIALEEVQDYVRSIK